MSFWHRLVLYALNNEQLLYIFAGEIQPLPVVVASGDGENGTQQVRAGKLGDAPYSPSAASFNKKGDLIYVGNFKGEILVIDTETRQTRTCVQVDIFSEPYLFIGRIGIPSALAYQCGMPHTLSVNSNLTQRY